MRSGGEREVQNQRPRRELVRRDLTRRWSPARECRPLVAPAPPGHGCKPCRSSRGHRSEKDGALARKSALDRSARLRRAHMPLSHLASEICLQVRKLAPPLPPDGPAPEPAEGRRGHSALMKARRGVVDGPSGDDRKERLRPLSEPLNYSNGRPGKRAGHQLRSRCSRAAAASKQVCQTPEATSLMRREGGWCGRWPRRRPGKKRQKLLLAHHADASFLRTERAALSPK